MRHALNVPNFGAFSDVALLVSLARDAEAAGWDGFFVWDHLLYVRGDDARCADPWIALAAIAAATTTIRLGPMVTPLPRRRPWLVARESVTLDRLSGGRLTLGVGLGAHPDVEYGQFGEDEALRIRAGKLDEGLAVLAGLWSGERVTFEGTHYRLRDVTFLPRPIQQPRIPVWVAGSWPNERPLRRAARWDGFVPIRVGPDGRGGPLAPEDVRAIRERLAAEWSRDETRAGPQHDVGEGHGAGPQHDAGAWRGEGARHDREEGRGESARLDPGEWHAPRHFDLVVAGTTPWDDRGRAADHVAAFEDAGATWWSEEVTSARGSIDEIRAFVRRGPPRG